MQETNRWTTPLPQRACDRDDALDESLTVNFPRGFACVHMYCINMPVFWEERCG
jgi:hypothetical protein